MSILGNDLLLGSGDEGYNLTRSLRFRSSASAYLNRTFTSTGNRQIWTWSGWVKRGALSSGTLFGADGSNYAFIYFSPNSLDCGEVSGGSQQWRRLTTQVFRDPSAWYHIVFAFDSTQATAANRIKLYVNGTQVTAFSTSADPSLNYNSIVNTTIAHSIGSFAAPTRQAYLDGYLTEVNFIDGQALTPSSFGSTNTLTGVWQPKAYAGTYGTNGFELQFTDNSALTTSSNVGLGKDFSGNGNYWTTNNISITSGTTYDSMTDVPTLTSATAANFAVLNPLDTGSNITLSAANLQTSQGAAAGISKGTIGISSGKWYWEVTLLSGTTSVGIASVTSSPTQNYVGQSSTSYGYYSGSGNKYNNATGTAYGASYTTNDVIGVALDMDAGTLVFYKNNTSQGTAYSSLSGTFTPAIGNDQSNTTAFNAGQRPFTYTPPTGYVALNTYNLPDSTIVNGASCMAATLYTGTAATLSVSNAVNGVGFQPDFVWFKSRSAAYNHLAVDSVRGLNKYVYPNLTSAEGTFQVLDSVNSSGFVVNASIGTTANDSGVTYVAWNWKAGQGTTSSNTSGSITSTVSVNASAGFSVVTYTGTNVSGATIGHGLGVAPRLIIIKNRSSVEAWPVYHSSVGATKYLVLNTSAAEATASTPWNNTAPTSTVFSLGNWNALNESGSNHVAYCWTPIAGYSAFGSYTGNGSSDGPMIYTGFKPKFVIIKRTDAVGDWYTFDSVRDPYNATQQGLSPNASASETTYTGWGDLLSNGFKIRRTDGAWNASGGTYIYMAFAENPFKNALAR